MEPSRFSHFDLRTTDVDGARAFYDAVLGPSLWGSFTALWPLHERAVAAGAPAHWMGAISIGSPTEVEARARAFIAGGGEQLGPVVPHPDGTLRFNLRDPFGAVLGFTSKAPPVAAPGERSPVRFAVLQTKGLDRAWSLYERVLGWSARERVELGGDFGAMQRFAWSADEHHDSGSARGVDSLEGCMIDASHAPHIHAHWLFFFEVPDLGAALKAVRDNGGLVVDKPYTLANGARVAPCDDPQGAAFGLIERRA